MSVFDSFFPPAFARSSSGAAAGPAASPATAAAGSSGGCGCGCQGHTGSDPSSSARTRAPEDALLERSLNAWTLECPEAVGVFRELGLDACCGGDRSLAEACRLHDLDPVAVLERLTAA